MQPHHHAVPTHPLRAVLFDLGGTLIATRRLIVTSYAQALAPYFGYTPSEHEIMAQSRGSWGQHLPNPNECGGLLLSYWDPLQSVEG